MAAALDWVVAELDMGGVLAVSAAVAEGDRFGETGNLEARSTVSAPGGCCWRWELPVSLVPEALSNCAGSICLLLRSSSSFVVDSSKTPVS